MSLASCRAALVALRERCLVTVVSVCNIKFRLTQCILSGLDYRGIVDFPELVYNTVVVGCGQRRFAFGSREGIVLRARVQHEDLALLRTARAQQRQAVGLRLGEGVLGRQDHALVPAVEGY